MTHLGLGAGMEITRKFTQSDESPFASIAFKTVTIEICHSDPNQRVCINEFEVPAGWSYAASEYLARHYLRKVGVPAKCRPVEEEGVPSWLWRCVAHEEAISFLPEEERYGAEVSSKQIFHRLAGAWTYWGWKCDYFDTETDARAFYDECCYMMAKQIISPASPQWLNTGLHWAYGIDGPAQGHYHVNPEDGKVCKSESAYQRPQHHHCFIQSVRDELVNDGGIMDLWEREARVFKYGSGAGCNMSAIRGAGEGLSGGTNSVGLMRFLSVGDKTAGAIKSGGNATQVDKMVLVDIDHPDIEAFVSWKTEEAHKAAALLCGVRQLRRHMMEIADAIAQSEGDNRFDMEHNTLLKQAVTQARRAMIPESHIKQAIDCAKQGVKDYSFPLSYLEDPNDLWLSISGQHAKLAVRASDSFMRKTEHDEDWELVGRVTQQPTEQVKAKELLQQLSRSTWTSGDPAIQFSDTIQAWHGCSKGGEIKGSSPRGEFLFLDDSACDIAVLNLLRFVDENGDFDVTRFEHVARLMVVMLDISITMAQYPSREIASNTFRYRPVGLSFCNLSGLLMRMGYAYDSTEARAVAAAIASLMTGAGYIASAELARELGAFEAFSENREGMMRLLWRHHEAAFGRTQYLGSVDVAPAALDHSSLPDSRLSDAIQRIWDLALIKGDEYGYSNSQISLLSASPKVAHLLDADTTSTTPETTLLHSYPQEFGGFVKHVPTYVPEGLKSLGYSDAQVHDMMCHLCGRGSLKDAPGVDHLSLLQNGFSEKEINRVEEALGNVTNIRHAFDPFIIGERFCREVLHLNDLQMHDAGFDLLSYLGFSEEDIAAASDYACGAGTLKDAPHIQEEDLAVFALARSDMDEASQLSVESQIQMMAAVQPFVSGGIAHTLKVAKTTPIEQCQTWMNMAWRMGLKSLSVERESCGLYDQVPEQELMETSTRDVVDLEEQRKHAIHNPRVMAVHMARSEQTLARKELPKRRSGFTQKATISDQTVYLRTGEYDDGQLGEIFIDMPKQPSTYQHMANQFAIAVSVALQYGVPLDAFVKVFSASQFEPAGDVEGSDAVQSASSILDYVFRELQAAYESEQAQGTAAEPKPIAEIIPLPERYEEAI